MTTSNAIALLGIDWGTSRFRLFCFDDKGALIRSWSDPVGIGTLSQSAAAAYLHGALEDYPGVPVLASGMVGASIGLKEVAYVECPFDLTKLAGHLDTLKGFSELKNAIRIVPGLKFAAPDFVDVLRGEETQALGWLAAANARGGKHSICLPGTHSKWLEIDQGNVTRIRTSLTGELFGLLAKNSVLVRGEQLDDVAEFDQGVEHALSEPSLIHALFSTRSRVVAGDHSAQHGASYLSGLLIASELLEYRGVVETLHLIGDENLMQKYGRVLEKFGITYQTWNGQDMAAKGLSEIWRMQ